MMSTYVIIMLAVIGVLDAARILGVYPFPSHSHFQLGDRIFQELARRGHEMVVISPFEQKSPYTNYKQIIVDGIVEQAAELKNNLLDHTGYSTFEKIVWLDAMGNNFTELVLNSSNVQKFLQAKNHFDLVIFEHFKSDAYNGFCFHFKAPCIAVSSVSSPTLFSDKVANSVPPSYVPHFLLSYSANMNFFQRIHNTIVSLFTDISSYLYSWPYQNYLLQKYFPEAPNLNELYYNLSLVLFNSHVSVNSVSPKLPNMIEIAGYHVYPPKKLPEDLQRYLDDASEGVIYFCMGSILQSADFPKHYHEAIINVFSKLKYKVLWKMEGSLISGQPSNVQFRSWVPQQDILAHPNVVLFITHGGLLSMIEAVYHGKPILGLPVYGDQEYNVVNAQDAGYGRYIRFQDLNEDNFRTELTELLSNPKYAARAKLRSTIMHDQPLTPLDRAIFWIEYVIRHKGAVHLRSSALNLNWFQFFLLDVIFAFLFSVFFIFLVIRWSFRKVCQFTRFYVNPKKIKDC